MRLQISDCRFQIGVLLSIVLSAFAARAGSAEVIERVLAVAAGDVILLSDVIAARDFGLVTPRGAADPVREILSRLIERALVLAEVDRYAPPEPEARAVDDALQTVRGRFPTPQA